MFAETNLSFEASHIVPIDVKVLVKGAIVPCRPDLGGDDDRPGAEIDMFLRPESISGFCELYVVGVGGIDISLVVVEANCDCLSTRDKRAVRKI